MIREYGSDDPKVQVVGGELDGAWGRVISDLTLADGTIEYTVKLDDGTVVVVTEKAASGISPREIGSP